MRDLYHATYQDEIFVQSRCIWHENTLLDFFEQNLTSLGWQQNPDNKKFWSKDKRNLIICLVDDIVSCNQNQKTVPYQFDNNTMVITDNWIGVPTSYSIYRLPESFFGIYYHKPQLNIWKPDRRFCFSQRRLDSKRLILFLEIMYRAEMIINSEKLDYINFNCWTWGGSNESSTGLQENYQQAYDRLPEAVRELYKETSARLLPQMPFSNHDLDHEQMYMQSWMNMVVETYSSDTTVALSEKLFRAMCLPAPWMVYGGKHCIAWLRSMGFDVLEDIIDHCYDTMVEQETVAYGDKPCDWIYEGAETVDKFKQQDFEQLSQRCQQAAEHNRNLLLAMKQRWPLDFAQWWADLVPKLA